MTEDDQNTEEKDISNINNSHLKTLISNREMILNCHDVISDVFYEHYHRTDDDMHYQSVVEMVSDEFKAVGYDEEKSKGVASSLMTVISYNEGSDLIQEYDDGEINNLFRILREWRRNYSAEVTYSHLRQYHGEYFWHSIRSDLVIRDPLDTLGFTHYIHKGENRVDKITTSLDGNIQLINRLINKQIEAIESFEEDACSGLQPSTIDNLVENVNYLLEKIQEHQEETSFNEGGETDANEYQGET